MGSLKSLSKRMRTAAKRVETLGNDLAIIGAEAALRQAVEVTPVDISTAVSGWVANNGSPSNEDVMAHVPGRFGSTRGASSQQAISEAVPIIKAKQPGVPLFLSNQTPYIGDLDDGSSRQFAGGFVPRMLIAFRLAVQNAKTQLWK